MSITRVSAPNQRAPCDVAVASSTVVGCIFYSDRGQSRIASGGGAARVAVYVQQSIATHENLKDVNVDVKGGVVRLTGTVPTEEDRLKVAVEARKAAGVRAVHDELRIRAGAGRTSG